MCKELKPPCNPIRVLVSLWQILISGYQKTLIIEMQQKPVRKLELKKKTISRLSQNQVQFGADSWTTIIYQTGGCVTQGCGSDFTRVTRTIVLPTGG